MGIMILFNVYHVTDKYVTSVKNYILGVIEIKYID